MMFGKRRFYAQLEDDSVACAVDGEAEVFGRGM
jgi:hypothetical protein